jgi:hypothetical protein
MLIFRGRIVSGQQHVVYGQLERPTDSCIDDIYSALSW